MGEGESSGGSGVSSLPMVSGLINFFETCGLGSGFDILEAFARALALGLRGRGVWLVFRVVAPILGGVFVRKVSRREVEISRC